MRQDANCMQRWSWFAILMKECKVSYLRSIFSLSPIQSYHWVVLTCCNDPFINYANARYERTRCKKTVINILYKVVWFTKLKGFYNVTFFSGHQTIQKARQAASIVENVAPEEKVEEEESRSKDDKKYSVQSRNSCFCTRQLRHCTNKPLIAFVLEIMP